MRIRPANLRNVARLAHRRKVLRREVFRTGKSEHAADLDRPPRGPTPCHTMPYSATRDFKRFIGRYYTIFRGLGGSHDARDYRKR